MKIPRMTSARMIPTSSAVCWSCRGTCELRHDDDEDEQVVDGQAVLRQPAGEELAAVLRAGEVPDPDAEHDRQPDEERDRDGALAHRRLVRPAADDEHVDGEQADQQGDADDPEPGRDVHEESL